MTPAFSPCPDASALRLSAELTTEVNDIPFFFLPPLYFFLFIFFIVCILVEMHPLSLWKFLVFKLRCTNCNAALRESKTLKSLLKCGITVID